MCKFSIGKSSTDFGERYPGVGVEEKIGVGVDDGVGESTSVVRYSAGDANDVDGAVVVDGSTGAESFVRTAVFLSFNS